MVIMGILKAAYPKFYINTSEKDIKSAIELWSTMFSDDALEVVKAAIYKLISEFTFPPTIADVKKRLLQITFPESKKTAVDGYAELMEAMRKYGHYNTQKAMDSFDPVLKKVVKSIGWETLCMSENKMADRAHFIKLYDVVKKQDNEEKLLPVELKNLIGNLSNNLMLK